MTDAAEEGQGRVRISVASDPLKVKKSVASLCWVKSQLLPKSTWNEPQHFATYYYPYYFLSWRATVPKMFGSTIKIRLVTGVNGMEKSAGSANEWPVEEEVDARHDEVLLPSIFETEAVESAQEYIKRFVMRRYRPGKPPKLEKEDFSLVHVPYYVYRRAGQPLHRATLIEGLTGVRGRVGDIPPISEAIAKGSTLTENYREGG